MTVEYYEARPTEEEEVIEAFEEEQLERQRILEGIAQEEREQQEWEQEQRCLQGDNDRGNFDSLKEAEAEDFVEYVGEYEEGVELDAFGWK